ncbi:MAG: WecB/TagA/CpsF family glycosyltransferase [Candidatus Omnitrophica bacterium]|nr:WecB/TagA/CpsF family glycosyltransferase [Candidatus Omnitrophota bacterium]
MSADNFFDVLGVRVSATNLELTSRRIEAWIQSKSRQYICVAPVATIIDCQRDSEYLKVINQAGLVTPDGMPIVWLGQKTVGPRVQRTYGPDLMMAFCGFSAAKGYRHFFYGGSEQTNQILIKTLSETFPGITIAGSYAPPHIQLHQKERGDIVEKINASRADVLWVGLGSPKQDFWMAEHRGRLNAPVLIGVGAAFDFLAGTKKQAPRWMQRSGLEWLFRLCQEPRRLWKRYLIGNSLFIFLCIKETLFFSKNKHNKN